MSPNNYNGHADDSDLSQLQQLDQLSSNLGADKRSDFQSAPNTDHRIPSDKGP